MLVTVKTDLIRDVQEALATLKRDPYMEYHRKTTWRLREILGELRREISDG